MSRHGNDNPRRRDASQLRDRPRNIREGNVLEDLAAERELDTILGQRDRSDVADQIWAEVLG